MPTFWQDLRYGLRMLGKNPGFTSIAVLTLALGIGANTAIFSLMDQILLRRLPVKNPAELVILRSPGVQEGHVWSDGDGAQSFSYLMYKNLRDNTSGIVSGMLARYAFDANISSRGQTERGLGELVSGNYFEVLGVQPAFGRLFTSEDERAPGGSPFVVLSHAYWLQHFGGDYAVLNQPLLVNNTELTVVGVAQKGFSGIEVGQTPGIFVPITMKPQMTPNRNGLDDWNDAYLAILARRKSKLSIAQTESALTAAYHPLLEQQLATMKNFTNKDKRSAFMEKKILLLPGASGRQIVQRDSGPAILTLFALVALVLLIACTNVANLLLAQGAARQREFAIRAAMGASRGRMIRQLLIETLLCAGAGGALGLVLGLWLMSILTPEVASSGVEGLTATLNPTILAFAVGTTLLSGLLFGLIPAWRVTRTSVSQTLKDQGSTGSVALSHVHFRKFLVAGQVAFTLLLLAGACLFTKTLWNLRNQSLGMNTTNVITFSVSPALNGYDAPRAIGLIDQLRERFTSLPGVRAVGSSEISSLTGTDMGGNITVEGGPQMPDEQNRVQFDSVSPSYFSTVGVPILTGREFNAGDNASGTKVAVINELLAKRYFPKRDPVGSHLIFGCCDKTPDILIVGVVRDSKQDHVRSEMAPFVFLPYAQQKSLVGMTFYVRTQQDPLFIADELRGSVRSLDPNLPVYDLKTFERVVDEDLLAERIIAGLSASFGVLAALLAALGIYGVLSYLVIQRTREIGIRIALGAATAEVRKLIFKEVGFMVIAGTVVGLPVAYALARLSESLLYGVRANSIDIYLLALAVIAVIAAVACYLPVRRATRVDPIIALRYE